jgi:phenylacetate-CoA ligase
MIDHFDRYEARSPVARNNALLRDLRAMLKIARPRAPALRQQLKGIEIDSIRTRADLAAIPVIRKSDLPALQGGDLPFGGLAATRSGRLKRLLVSPGPIFEPEGNARDWWGSARAMYAAGFRKGDIVLNTFSYHLTPGGHMMESGAAALGCPVIPAGPGNVEQQMDAIRAYRPDAYCGTPDFLKILLDKAAEAKVDATSIRKALVSGAALPGSLRKELTKRGVAVFQAYGTAELGMIAYETEAMEGLVSNEGIILEIVRPGTNDPVKDGDVGEVVVTRLNADYPLLRFGTGDLSAVMRGPSPCGRTSLRIKGWLGRADQTTKVKGMFVHATQIAEVGRRHPEVGRLRLVVSRRDEQDIMELHVERKGDGPVEPIADSLQAVTKLRGTVKVVAPGSLPNDGKVIADERPVG